MKLAVERERRHNDVTVCRVARLSIVTCVRFLRHLKSREQFYRRTRALPRARQSRCSGLVQAKTMAAHFSKKHL